ncbi:fimbrial biogenesis chaperone [Fulvimonas yonginensis]|uniref:Fimbria/pilus periplasmic chaperone n=1 Tax=Fulvimonas yonginensis TaxID=1495200 RepID=A0ABU8JCK0_9GAMM
MKRSRARQAACGLAFLFLAIGPALAGSFQVGPVTATLSADHRVAALTVRNTGAEATTIQLQAKAWSQSDGKDVFAPADDILATPPIFTIPAGGSQVIRVGSRRAPDAQHERAYRLFLREVPPAPNAGQQGLRMVLEISLPVFVQPTAAIAPDVHWRATRIDGSHVRLTASNTGTAHARLSHFVLSGADGKRLPMSTNPVYILPGNSHTWVVDAAVAEGTHLQLAMDSNDQTAQADVAVAGP